MENILSWISAWFSSYCNGDREHRSVIRIETLDNPGWMITIDLEDTGLEHLDFSIDLVENHEHDWYTYKVKNEVFTAVGDLGKLEFLLTKFKELVESNEKGTLK